jgi:predicted transcriptional regulator of viral defense system
VAFSAADVCSASCTVHCLQVLSVQHERIITLRDTQSIEVSRNKLALSASELQQTGIVIRAALNRLRAEVFHQGQGQGLADFGGIQGTRSLYGCIVFSKID